MKKISTILGLLSASMLVNAQTVTTNVELDATFDVSTPGSVATSPNAMISSLFQIDGADNILQLNMTSKNFFNVEWTSPELSEIDSLLVNFKLNKSVVGTAIGNWSAQGDDLLLTSTNNIVSTYNGMPVNLNATSVLNFGSYISIIDKGSYLDITRKMNGPIYDATKIPVLKYVEEGQGNYMLFQNSFVGTGPTLLDAAIMFCQQASPQNLFGCIGQLSNSPIPPSSQDAGIDDLVITSYSTVTGIEDAQAVSKEISGVYNLMGQESSIEATNQVLVVKYTDGSSERVYNVR